MSNFKNAGKMNLSTRDWEAVFHAISDPAMILGLNYRIIACNPATARLLGKNQKDIVGHLCYELFHCTDRPPAGCPHHELLRAKTPQPTAMELQITGGVYQVTVTPVLDNRGQLRHTLHIAKEITASRQLAKNLRESTEILEKVFASEHFLFAVMDTSFTFLKVNKAYADNCHTTPEQLVGKKHFDLFPHAENEEIFRRVVSSGEPYTALAKPFEYPDQPQRGLTYWDWTLSPIRDAAGGIEGVLLVLKEVTERKRAELALRANEKKFRRLVENIGREYIIYTHDIKGTFTYVSPSVTSILGYTQEEFLAHYPDYLTDNPKNKELLRHAELRLNGAKQSSYEVEILHKNGNIHVLEVMEEPVIDPRGVVIAVEGIVHDITGIKKAQDEVSELEYQWANAMDFIDDAIYLVGPDDCVKMANSAFYTFTGLTPEQTIGKNIETLLHKETSASTCPICRARRERHDLEVILDADHEVNLFKRPIQVMVRMIRDKEGEVRNILIGIRDLSPWEELRKQGLIFNQLHEAVITTDTKGLVTNWNNGAKKLTGYDLGEAMGKPISTFFWDKIPWHFERRTHIRAADQEMEVWVLQKFGKLVPALISSSVIQKRSGEITGTIYCLMDISERKVAEEKLCQSQKMEAIGNLAGGIAHDFNNILSPVFGYTELAIANLPKSSEERKYLAEVLTAARRAKDLVKQILAFSRKSEQEKRPTPIHLLVKEALKLLRASLPTTIEIRQNLMARDDLVLCDPTQIHQIMMNLCTNALYAMQERGGVLEVSLENITISGNDLLLLKGLRPGPYIRLSISDTGEGMDEKTKARIFEPYFTTKAKGEGTGLGLSVVHGIVLDLNGHIQVTSVPGQGTIFHIYLPRVEVKPLFVATGPSLEEPPHGSERILLVDDEEPITRLLSKVLEQLGYQVSSFNNSVEAFQAFRSAPDQFDLVITDQTMPYIPGSELAKKMLVVRPDIPIILCTGYSSLISEEKAKSLGISRFIMKPIVRNELAAAIRAVLDKERGAP